MNREILFRGKHIHVIRRDYFCELFFYDLYTQKSIILC